MSSETESTDATRSEIAARVRAAIGYRGLKLDDVVERCPLVTAANIRRTVGARRDTPERELVQIARACEVPLSWLTRGYWDESNPPETTVLRFGEGSHEDRITVLETYVAVLARALAMLGIDAESLLQSDSGLPASRASQRDGNSH